MTDSLLIDALGSTVRVDLAGLDADDSAAVREAWRDALAPANSDAASTVAPHSGRGRAAMLMSLSQQVTLAALEAGRGDLWMLHAAGLALADGRVVVLIGPSGRGKTTAARILGQDFGYVSDESIGIAPDGSVLPYRKPLSIIEQHGHPKAERAASDIGLKPLPDAQLRLAAIVLLDRRVDGPHDPLVQSVELGDAIEDLVSQSSCLPDMAAPLQTIARHAEATGGIVRATYRHVESLRPLVEGMASRAQASQASYEVHLRPADIVDDGEPRYERADFVDAIALDQPDRVVVLNRGRRRSTVRVLAGVAPAIWRASSGVGFGTLVAAAVDAYGEPEGIDVREVVSSAAAQLLEAGVLTRGEG